MSFSSGRRTMPLSPRSRSMIPKEDLEDYIEDEQSQADNNNNNTHLKDVVENNNNPAITVAGELEANLQKKESSASVSNAGAGDDTPAKAANRGRTMANRVTNALLDKIRTNNSGWELKITGLMRFDCLAKLCEALAENTSTNRLDLEGAAIGDQGCILIRDLLARNKSITTLDLTLNQISDAGCVHLAEAIPGSSLNRLFLSDNVIQDKGVMALAKSRTKSMEIFLRGNQRVSTEALAMLEGNGEVKKKKKKKKKSAKKGSKKVESSSSASSVYTNEEEEDDDGEDDGDDDDDEDDDEKEDGEESSTSESENNSNFSSGVSHTTTASSSRDEDDDEDDDDEEFSTKSKTSEVSEGDALTTSVKRTQSRVRVEAKPQAEAKTKVVSKAPPVPKKQQNQNEKEKKTTTAATTTTTAAAAAAATGPQQQSVAKPDVQSFAKPVVTPNNNNNNNNNTTELGKRKPVEDSSSASKREKVMMAASVVKKHAVKPPLPQQSQQRSSVSNKPSSQQQQQQQQPRTASNNTSASSLTPLVVQPVGIRIPRYSAKEEPCPPSVFDGPLSSPTVVSPNAVKQQHQQQQELSSSSEHRSSDEEMTDVVVVEKNNSPQQQTSVSLSQTPKEKRKRASNNKEGSKSNRANKTAISPISLLSSGSSPLEAAENNNNNSNILAAPSSSNDDIKRRYNQYKRQRVFRYQIVHSADKLAAPWSKDLDSELQLQWDRLAQNFEDQMCREKNFLEGNGMKDTISTAGAALRSLRANAAGLTTIVKSPCEMTAHNNLWSTTSAAQHLLQLVSNLEQVKKDVLRLQELQIIAYSQLHGYDPSTMLSSIKCPFQLVIEGQSPGFDNRIVI